MAHPPAPALVLRDGDEAVLRSWSRSTAGRAGIAQRARIVLLASQGLTNSEIAHRVGVTRQTVISRRSAMRPMVLVGSRTRNVRAGRAGSTTPRSWRRR